MKKLFATFLSLLLLFSLTACGNSGTTEPEPVDPPKESPGTAPTTPETSEPVVLTGDSYWVVYESEGDTREYVPEGEDLLTDLTLWADGTARIREIEDGMWLVSPGEEQNMTWTCESDGTLKLYTASGGDDPFCTGTVTADGMELSRFGGIYRFKQESMPEEGALYSPAELQGVWIQTGTEIEGSIEEDLPGRFNSLVFRTDWADNEKTLLASSETDDYSHLFAEGRYYNQEITLLEYPLYEGCGNDIWSVRIGAESPLNENGYPEETETYVTLLDQNTLLQQHYFSFDGGPGVSYQTYKRVLSEVPYDVEAADLSGCSFTLAGYIDADGVRHAEHPEYSDFRLYLDGSLGYLFSYDIAGQPENGYQGGGYHWSVGDGGTILMRREDSLEGWYTGAVHFFNETPTIRLFDNMGGILCLEQTEGGEWDGYADTMNDIEGNAFAAPANTLFVLYNQDYGNFWALPSIPCYEISDSPEAQYVLVSSVEDGTYLWLEENGYCREDFGTVDAGESIMIRLEIPESGGMNLQVTTSLGDYFYELTQSSLAFEGGWNYITT